MNSESQPKMNGAELIYRERNRQLRVEGWTTDASQAGEGKGEA